MKNSDVWLLLSSVVHMGCQHIDMAQFDGWIAFLIQLSLETKSNQTLNLLHIRQESHHCIQESRKLN